MPNPVIQHSLRGRFAPSPTGPLHLGSLLSALASWLDIRQRGGSWLVRIDDIDPPREVPGAAERILRQLEAHGLYWDEAVQYQSRRHEAYREAINTLLDSGHAFYCELSRRQLNAQYHGCHPGSALAVSAGPDRAIRLAVPDDEIRFDDRLQGPCHCNLHSADGAFVIRRRDGLFAYQLACALDDADMGISEVLRGVDLLDSSFRQIHVLDCLGRSRPGYGHLPVVVDEQGQKLSKSAGSAALDDQQPAANLCLALRLLEVLLPADMAGASVDEILQQAVKAWQPDRLTLRQQVFLQPQGG